MNTENLILNNTTIKACRNCDRLLSLAEDKRFAQLAVPVSAFASRCSLGFFDRCASTALAVSSAGRARRLSSRRGTRLSAQIFHHCCKRKRCCANAQHLFLAEDKRFEIRLRHFTLFHQASKSQVLSHFFTFTFHEFSHHFTKTKDM